MSSAPPLEKLPVAALKGVGNALAQTLAKLGLHSVQDMLFHLPLRYLDRTHVVPIGDLSSNTSVVVQGVVHSNQVVLGRRRSLLITLQDDTGRVGLRFFHFTAAQRNAMAEGALLRCYGDPRLGASGLELYHPEYEILTEADSPPPLQQSLTPVYPLTEGLTQARLRKLIQQALEIMKLNPPAELLPAEINRQFQVNSLGEALAYVHSPPKTAPVAQLLEGTHPYQARLAFEELLAHHLALRQSREMARQELAPAFKVPKDLLARFYQSLPFQPTDAQARVIQDIFADVTQDQPMLRLIQGDVGSGKTLVAAAAALAALHSGYQVALAAPTEILAEQHRHQFTQWLTPLGFKVAWLAGKQTAKQKRDSLTEIESGSAAMVVGTHALFQEAVTFARLGLVMIDEQHRFGVHQRLSLRNKSGEALRPHQLVLTATPIPRTLAMTAYADLDLSIIDALPPGRTPINTVLISQQRRGDVIQRVRTACEAGHQVYWVCTLVEDSETLAASAAQEVAAELTEALPEVRVGLVHGRLKSKEKEQTMSAFKAGEVHLLVATTVIEVGVDVPNASLMIIENPERLGLAQLHQLRGRVGRGHTASHCVLLYGHPLSQLGRQRLQVLRQSNDGFVIAEQDLQLRGPGELLGTSQTGLLHLRLADLQRDTHLLPQVRSAAEQLLHHHPELGARIINRWFSEHQQYLRA